MKRQDIFDKVVTHLMAQGRAATKRLKGEPLKTCAYRGGRDTMCAMGCLIPDELYHREFEGSDLEHLMHRAGPDYHTAFGREPLPPEARAALNAWIKHVGQRNLPLIARLQGVHDIHEARPWKRSKKNRLMLLERLADVAKDHNLKTSHLPAFAELTGVNKRAS